MREKIYQDDWKYNLVKPWVGSNVRHSYRKCQIHGLENIPTDGTVLIAPNHCNTLLDALVVLRAYKEPTVFGARADIFKKPLIAKFMYFARILPMVRQRDGLRNVLKNKDTQEIIVEILENDVRFCMFPEGTHRPKHSLQTLGKGVFRAALAANEKFGAEKPVYIVPAGLEYGDYFRYRSTSLVNIGKPINVTEFVKDLDLDNEAQIMDALRKELSSRMAELITYFAFDENYEEKWALTKMIAVKDRKKAYGEFGTDLYEDMLRNREIAADIEKAMEEHPEEMAEVLAEVKEFENRRKKAGISIYSFKKKSSPLMNVIGKGFAALIGLPYFIFSAVSNLPLWATSFFVRSKVRDKAFRNTVSFGVKLGMTTLLLPILAALAFIFAPWWLALTLLVLWIPGYSYFHDYIEACRRWFSDIRLLRERKIWKSFKGIVKKYQNL
ncbi:MAG: 1-acyl-sn-glycerol-3-phosphate acyltransferase [Bacteroidales bacterium]|nr:1-acyl-sn-glycerol-3-phosphate acyltransferase [Bacteroidales bacterium]MBR5834193.1 1-acyl-sn-glycerol-3-phosphate acyltransferase [Bacteroidales bacterium]